MAPLLNHNALAEAWAISAEVFAGEP
jgi:hypothetical protein